MSRCPPERQLQQFLDEQLPAAESRVLSSHVTSCERCQAVLERLTEEDGVGESHSLSSGSHIAVAPDPSADFLARLRETPVSSDAERSSEVRSAAAPQVSGYEIIREVGRGGMGVVYQARHLGLNRLVALKMVRSGGQAGPKELARFRQEAEAVARLHHPNIVQIYDIGDASGQPYLALEYVDGGSLVQRLRGDPQPVYPAARLVETLARAVHFAHEHGVIHRDLKPANILLTGNAERGTGDGRAIGFPRSQFLVPHCKGCRFRAGQAARRTGQRQRERRGGRHAELHGSGAGRGVRPSRSGRRPMSMPWERSSMKC